MSGQANQSGGLANVEIGKMEYKYRMFGQTNFGCTGDQLRMAHFALAMEFEKLRY